MCSPERLAMVWMGSAALLSAGCRDRALAGKPDPRALASAQSSPIPQQPTPSPATIKLRDLSQARGIRIREDSNGELGPAAADYRFRRDNGGFAGEADFSAGYEPSYTRHVELGIPAKAAQVFLQTLMESPVQEGEYEEGLVPTDVFGSTTIEVDVGKETISFSRTSPASRPWKVALGGRTYVTNTDDPSKALDGLWPHLKMDVFKQLRDRAREALERSRPTPRPGVAPQLRLVSDFACEVSVDGEPMVRLKANDEVPKDVKTSLGQHLIVALSTDGKLKWRKVWDAKPGPQAVVIRLKDAETASSPGTH